MALSNRSIQLGLKFDHGIDFTEFTGYWPMPETCGGVLKIFDENNNVHVLVLDHRDGCFYDITMREGPTGSYITNEFKDKVSTDGTGGYNIETEVRFKEDTGEYEKFVVEHDISRFYVRPYDESSRNIEGYDSNGYISGTEFTSEIYTDGEPVVSNALSKRIPPTGEIVYDKKTEGHRLQTALKSNMSGFKLVGRQQEYIVKDINEYPDNRILNEGLCQKAISNIFRRITRSSPLTERITRYTVSGTVVTGPDGGYSAVEINETTPLFTLPQITTPNEYMIIVWLKSDNLITESLFTTSSSTFGLVESEYVVNDYVLCYGEWEMDSGFSGGLLNIDPTAATSIFDFRMVKIVDDSVSTEDILEYLYKDATKNNFDNVCPVIW